MWCWLLLGFPPYFLHHPFSSHLEGLYLITKVHLQPFSSHQMASNSSYTQNRNYLVLHMLFRILQASSSLPLTQAIKDKLYLILNSRYNHINWAAPFTLWASIPYLYHEWVKWVALNGHLWWCFWNIKLWQNPSSSTLTHPPATGAQVSAPRPAPISLGNCLERAPGFLDTKKLF